MTVNTKVYGGTSVSATLTHVYRTMVIPRLAGVSPLTPLIDKLSAPPPPQPFTTRDPKGREVFHFPKEH